MLTRMVRFAQRSPNGDSIVFESLGKLWVQRGNNTPTRLTRDANGFEYSPAWSPDSKKIYFLNWQDTALSSIRVVSARGGKSRSLSSKPAHLNGLAISKDGSTLLTQKLSGTTLTGTAWGKHPGIYSVDIKSKSLHKLRKSGFNPHFGPNGRIYFNERKRSTTGRGSDDAKTKLYSMTAAGNDVREAAYSQLARRITLSPNGQMIAYQEGYDVYVSPRPQTGQPLELGPSTKNLPMRRISEVGGLYMHWSADSSQVSWSVGPDLYSVNVAKALNNNTVEPAITNLSTTVSSARPSGTVAITNANIITMNDTREVVQQATLLVEDNRITQVGKNVTIPDNAAVFDATGKTVIPGLIDAHAHGGYGRADIVPQQNANALAHLALGVTTLHNPSSVAKLAFAAAEYQRAGLILSPRIFSTAEIIYGAKSTGFANVQSLNDALGHVKRLKAQGAISVKNYNQPRREQRQQVVEAARQENMLVFAEGGSLYHMDMNLLADGNTGIEHNVPALNMYNDVTQFWQASDVGYTPTLVVTYGGLTSEDYYYAESNIWEHPILSNFVPPEVLEPRSVRRITAPDRDFRDDDAAAAAKVLLEAGVIVNTGAHGQREGLATHWEMWSFARGGMSPMQVLSLATVNPAKYLGMHEQIGSIEAGKLADLVILNADPLENIRNTDKVSHVMLNGRLYRAEDLSEEITGDSELAPFWWKTSGAVSR